MGNFLSWMLPPGASTFVGDIDWLYYLILVVTGIAFVVVEVALVVFCFRYRARPARKAIYVHGSTRAEVIWTGVTAVVVVIIGLLSAPAWNKIKGREGVPPNAMEIGISAKQFEWNVTYPGADGKLGTADDYTVRGQLHVPVDRPTVATLTTRSIRSSSRRFGSSRMPFPGCIFGCGSNRRRSVNTSSDARSCAGSDTTACAPL